MIFKILLLFLTIFISHLSFGELSLFLNYSVPEVSKEIKLEMNRPYIADLEPGDQVSSLSIMSRGEFRILQQTQTSVTVMDEGPHIDLLEWEHGLSSWDFLKSEGQKFIIKNQFEKMSFPKVKLEDLVRAVAKKAGKDWEKIAKKCKSVNDYPCAVAPSRYEFKIEEKIDNHYWIPRGVVVLISPMGC